MPEASGIGDWGLSATNNQLFTAGDLLVIQLDSSSTLMKKLVIVHLAILFIFKTAAYSDNVAAWNFYSLPATNIPATNNMAATYYDPLLEAAPVFKRGEYFGDYFVPPTEHVFQVQFVGGNISLDSAISLGSYFEFSFQLPQNVQVEFSSFSINVSLAYLNMGPVQFSLLSSIGGFESTEVIGGPITLTSISLTEPQNIQFSDLALVSTNSQVSFRVYAHGDGASFMTNNMVRFGNTGDMNIDGFIASGNVSIVPEIKQTKYLFFSLIIIWALITSRELISFWNRRKGRTDRSS